MSKKSSSQAVSVKSLWEFEKVNRNQENENHLLVTLTGGEAPEEKNRKPVALQGVIDCSGSMGGTKIEYVQKTLMVLVDHLTDDDYLGLTAYSSTVWEICPITKCNKSGKELLKKRIREEVRPTSMTNLSGGFIEGCQTLQAKDLGSEYLQRILLLTDGLANEGIQTHTGLVGLVKKHCEDNKNITLSTFGYASGIEGSFDFDPELLTSMAKAGRGNYHHISSPDKVPGALGQEIGGLLSCVAQNIKISLRLNDNVEVLEVLNDYDVSTNNKITTIKVDDIYAKEERTVVVKLKVPKMSESFVRPIKVLDIDVKYVNTSNSESETIKEPVKLSFVKSGQESKEANEIVEKEIALLAVALSQEEANNLADKGDHDGAKNSIQRGIELIKKCSLYSKDVVLQGLADGLENLKPRYDRHLYGSNVKGFATTNSSMLRTKRALSGGMDSLSESYGNMYMAASSESFSQSVDKMNEEESLIASSSQGSGSYHGGCFGGSSRYPNPPFGGVPGDPFGGIPNPPFVGVPQQQPIKPVVSDPVSSDPNKPYEKKRSKSSR